MNIAGFQKQSFVDYPGKCASVIFTASCNMTCKFCHNRNTMNTTELIPETEVFQYLWKRNPFLEGVVVSGGEPTIQNDLPEFIQQIKFIGYQVKLDTNGLEPAMLRQLYEENLIDYCAMDIKAPIDNYSMVPGCYGDPYILKTSIEIIKNSQVPYEFRTTVVPELTVRDIETIRSQIGHDSNYVLQIYRRDGTKQVAPFINEIKNLYVRGA